MCTDFLWTLSGSHNGRFTTAACTSLLVRNAKREDGSESFPCRSRSSDPFAVWPTLTSRYPHFLLRAVMPQPLPAFLPVGVATAPSEDLEASPAGPVPVIDRDVLSRYALRSIHRVSHALRTGTNLSALGVPWNRDRTVTDSFGAGLVVESACASTQPETQITALVARLRHRDVRSHGASIDLGPAQRMVKATMKLKRTYVGRLLSRPQIRDGLLPADPCRLTTIGVFTVRGIESGRSDRSLGSQ